MNEVELAKAADGIARLMFGAKTMERIRSLVALNPLRAVGIAALVGLILGALI